MASPAENDPESGLAAFVPTAERKRRRWAYRMLTALLVILLALVAYGWTAREQIARDLIGEQLAAFDLPATYNVDSISPDAQVLTDIVIGDPARPDLTVERVEIALAYGFGVPEIGRITLINPRIYGTYREGAFSFGALDDVLFAESDGPTGLPAWDVRLVDGRGLIESEYGSVGIKAAGEGRLDSGFSGILALAMPQGEFAGCEITDASVYGDIVTNSGQITLSGPIRAGGLACQAQQASVRDLAMDAGITLDETFTRPKIVGSFTTRAVSYAGFASNSASGRVDLAVGESGLDSDFDIALMQVANDQLSVGQLELDGVLRARNDLANIELQLDIEGQGAGPQADSLALLMSAENASEGTLVQPLLAKMRGALDRQLRDASLSASLTVRQTGAMRSAVVPQAVVRNRAGSPILSLSRLQYAANGDATPRISGNFRISGRDLPAVIGRMEQKGTAQSVFRLKLAEYAAGSSRLAIPDMRVTQGVGGALGFAGLVKADGPLPGGEARGLRLPVQGRWSGSDGLTLWRSCTDIGFDRLVFANLELSRRDVKLCPAPGRAIVRQDAGDLRIAAGIPSLDVAGTLAGTPIRIASGPVGIAYPGVATARELTVSLGESNESSAFQISDITARLGDDISGTFTGADIGLYAIPLDLKQSQAQWRYADGVFQLEEGQFRLVDRTETARFEPLLARDATLSLEENIIQASALLREPDSDRVISQVSIRHDLGTGAGFADLQVDRLTFDDALQPTDLTPLALGVVANVEGLVTGTGRIDWSADVVSSSGVFSSRSLDLAAAFGPVKGASGTVEFSDLLSLTTAPGQSIRVASVNPGIEAKDGIIGFTLREGQFLGVTGGRWPFMGGELTLRPVNLNLGVAEERRYVLEVEGLDAALFVENLELGNLAATGTFDGVLPLIFDELGFGRIEGGNLQSRTLGGNVSYVGELTYEDLSAIANYAFDTLRSLDYDSMQIAMDGPLTGEIVTRVRFDGVEQGEGTKQNFITRQIGDLPIRFNVNIKAPFYKLVTTLKSIYDPSTVRDPRELGLLGDDGTRFIPAGEPLPDRPALPDLIPDPAAIKPDELPIQTSDSEEMP